MYQEDSSALLHSLHRRESRAYQDLIKRCLPPFSQWVKSRYPQFEEYIPDLCHDALIALIEYLNNHPGFTPDRGIFAYYFTILKNTCHAAARRNKYLPLAGSEDQLANKAGEEQDHEPALNFDDYCDCLRQLFEKNERAALVIVHRDAEAFEKFPHRKEGTCFEGIEYKTDEELRMKLGFEDIRSVRVLRNRWRERLKDCLRQKKLDQE